MVVTNVYNYFAQLESVVEFAGLYDSQEVSSEIYIHVITNANLDYQRARMQRTQKAYHSQNMSFCI